MTATPRAVELSLFPELRANRAVGPLVHSVITGDNSALIAQVAPMYLDGAVCDVTYGRGGWWRDWRPANLTCHDLNTVDGVDFTALPEPDNTYDAVTFDPPYIPHPSAKAIASSSGGAIDFRLRYGINVARSDADLMTLIGAGVAECSRVLKPRGWLLVKCGDWPDGTQLATGHRMVLDLADLVGLRCHDLIIHHTGPGPGGHNIVTQQRSRRAHSYLLVFRKRPPVRKAKP